MNITSYEYRGYEIVVMPGGKCLVHSGSRAGELVGEAPSLRQAMALADLQAKIADQAREAVAHNWL